MKYDVVMWARDGAFCLPAVLKRIDSCLPVEVVGQKVFIDDASADFSAEIAKDYGWAVYDGGGLGIGHAANLALSKVKTGRFISFEQDVYLVKDWFDRVPPLLDVPGRAVVQGWRLSTERTLRDLDLLGVWRFGCDLYSIDNNVFKTDAVKRAGGFSADVVYHVDAVLRNRINLMGLGWFCDTSVISVHYKPLPYGAYVKRQYRMYMEHPKLMRMGVLADGDSRKLRKRSLIAGFLRSPLAGVAMAVKMGNPNLVPYYVMLRYAKLKANIGGS